MTDRPPCKPTRLTGLYVRNFLANFTGNCIIILLNIFTPLAVYENWKAYLWQGGGIGGWVHIPIALILVVGIVIGLQYRIQRPISTGLGQLYSGKKLDAKVLAQARRRLVNLPSILWWYQPDRVGCVDIPVHAADVFSDRHDDPQLFLWLFPVTYDRINCFIYFLFRDRSLLPQHINTGFFPRRTVSCCAGHDKNLYFKKIRVLWVPAPMRLWSCLWEPSVCRVGGTGLCRFRRAVRQRGACFYDVAVCPYFVYRLR